MELHFLVKESANLLCKYRNYETLNCLVMTMHRPRFYKNKARNKRKKNV